MISDQIYDLDSLECNKSYIENLDLKIDLIYLNLGLEKLITFIEPIAHSVKTLDLEFPDLEYIKPNGQNFFEPAGNFLRRFKYLKGLKILIKYCKPLFYENAHEIFKSVKECELETLDIRIVFSRNFTDDSNDAIIEVLDSKQLYRLKHFHLTLTCTSVKHEGVDKILRSLTELEDLVTLNLIFCEVKFEKLALKRLKGLYQKHKNLENVILFLEDNNLQALDFENVIDAFKVLNRNLKKLKFFSFKNNYITKYNYHDLLTVFKHFNLLTEFDLKLEEEMMSMLAVHISDCLMNYPNLTSLTLKFMYVSKYLSNFEILFACLKVNKLLTYLDLDVYNPSILSDSKYIELFKFFDSLTEMEKLYLALPLKDVKSSFVIALYLIRCYLSYFHLIKENN